MSRHRQAFIILCLAATFTLAYGIFVRVAPWRAELAEADVHANVIRLQAFFFDPAPHSVIVGSSISGRLLPRYFNGTSIGPLANLGLDGSSPNFGLDLVLKRPPPLVIVEENELLKPWNANDDLLMAATKSVSFRLASWIPMLRARCRPSSVVYAWLKLHRKPAASNAASGITFPVVAPVSASTAHSPSIPSTTVQATHEKLRRQIEALKSKGTRVVLLRLPGEVGGKDNAAFVLGDQLAQELNLSQLDVSAECASRGLAVQFTDGKHLTPSSACVVSRLIAELLPDHKPGKAARVAVR